MLIHTGERPYKCEFEGCEYRSNQSGTLKTHMKTHLGIIHNYSIRFYSFFLLKMSHNIKFYYVRLTAVFSRI